MRCLLDGDIIAFSCSIYNENYGWEACVSDIDSMIERIMYVTKSDSYEIYLSGDHNFRYDINPNYKANRKDNIDPRYRQDAKEYLIVNYGAVLCDGIEADDALGIAQTDDTILCSIDKDLKQIPGRHYNWRRDEFTSVTPLDGLRTFYRQLLTGDRTDNLFGIRGIGTVRSSKLIDHLEDESDMFELVQMMYDDDTRLLMNGQCLYILRNSEEERWAFPNLRQQP